MDVSPLFRCGHESLKITKKGKNRKPTNTYYLRPRCLFSDRAGGVTLTDQLPVRLAEVEDGGSKGRPGSSTGKQATPHTRKKIKKKVSGNTVRKGGRDQLFEALTSL